jgi:hypothetical protein
LHTACAFGQLESAQILLMQPLQPDWDPVSAVDDAGDTPAKVAAAAGHAQVELFCCRVAQAERADRAAAATELTTTSTGSSNGGGASDPGLFGSSAEDICDLDALGLALGGRVVISGLVSKPELNGCSSHGP